MRALLFSLLVFTCSFFLLQAKEAYKIDLKDGDTFVFLGDSITHKGYYTRYIETFFVTRYPEKQIRFINSGISGDKALDALHRFEEDIAQHKPNYVSIMLGMNDGQYKDFSHEIFETYQNDMSQVIDQINDLGAQPILISPTIFDQRQYDIQSEDPNFRFNRLQASRHYNSTMAFFGAWVREQAMRRDLPFVHFWGPLNQHTLEHRQIHKDYSFALDAIHPEAPGHAIMAFSFIHDLAPSRKRVSAIHLFKEGEAWHSQAQNAKLENLNASGDNIEFSVTAKSLPWILPEEAQLGYDLTKAGHKWSQESFRVTGLKAGTYRLSIDEQDIGTFTHRQLGKKIELQNFRQSPQAQQALKVALAIEEKFETAVLPYRQKQARFKGLRRRFGANSPELENYRKKEGPSMQKLLLQQKQLSEKIYKLSTPQKHRYKLERS